MTNSDTSQASRERIAATRATAPPRYGAITSVITASRTTAPPRYEGPKPGHRCQGHRGRVQVELREGVRATGSQAPQCGPIAQSKYSPPESRQRPPEEHRPVAQLGQFFGRRRIDSAHADQPHQASEHGRERGHPRGHHHRHGGPKQERLLVQPDGHDGRRYQRTRRHHRERLEEHADRGQRGVDALAANHAGPEDYHHGLSGDVFSEVSDIVRPQRPS